MSNPRVLGRILNIVCAVAFLLSKPAYTQEGPAYSIPKFSEDNSLDFRTNVCDRQQAVVNGTLQLKDALTGLNISVAITDYSASDLSTLFGFSKSGTIKTDDPGLFVVLLDEIARRCVLIIVLSVVQKVCWAHFWLLWFGFDTELSSNGETRMLRSNRLTKPRMETKHGRICYSGRRAGSMWRPIIGGAVNSAWHSESVRLCVCFFYYESLCSSFAFSQPFQKVGMMARLLWRNRYRLLVQDLASSRSTFHSYDLSIIVSGFSSLPRLSLRA